MLFKAGNYEYSGDVFWELEVIDETEQAFMQKDLPASSCNSSGREADQRWLCFGILLWWYQLLAHGRGNTWL